MMTNTTNAMRLASGADDADETRLVKIFVDGVVRRQRVRDFVSHRFGVVGIETHHAVRLVRSQT